MSHETDATPQRLVSDWRELEVELGSFGTMLEELRVELNCVDQDVISDLEQRYDDISRQVIELKDKTTDRLIDSETGPAQARDDRQILQGAIDTVTEQAGNLCQQVSDTVGAATDTIKDLASNLNERSLHHREAASDAVLGSGHRVKSAAQDMGHGLAKAWGALKRDLESAYRKIKDGNGSAGKS